MASMIKRQVASKIGNVLKSVSVKKDNEAQLKHKIEYFVKINRVDKNSNEFGTFHLNLNDLKQAEFIVENKLNEQVKNELEASNDDLIESVKIENSKVVLKTNLKKFKQETLSSIFTQKNSYGFNLNENDLYPKWLQKPSHLEWQPKKQSINTIVEFSSPNIAKPLHAGHMRSTFLGNFLSNIHQKLGQNVTRINYLGDWGTQYGILAVGFKKFGSFEKLKESPIKHLLDVYVQANKDETIKNKALEYFSQMESKNEESLKMWELFKELSIKELVSIYEKLNMKFDVYESESQYYELAKICVAKLLEMNIAQKLENNAIQVKLSVKKGNSNKVETMKYILQKQDGSTLYISRDIAALLERKKKYQFSKIVYVVDSSQRDHFVRLYETMKMLDRDCLSNITFEEFYVPFGRLTNMSTRKGKVEMLNDLITEAKSVALESMENLKIKKNVENVDYTAQILGNSHLIISDLARPRLKDYEFSWANMVSKDDSAFMCHYAHARIHNLLIKCKEELQIQPELENVDLNLLDKNIDLILIQHLARFEEVVWQSYQEYEPYHIVQYLFQLVRLTNLCLSENYVVGEAENIAKARLLLYYCSKQVISNAFKVLGISPLDRI